MKHKKDDKQIKFNFRQRTILNVIFSFFHNFGEFILKCRQIWSTRSTACKVMTVRVTWLVFSATEFSSDHFNKRSDIFHLTQHDIPRRDTQTDMARLYCPGHGPKRQSIQIPAKGEWNKRLHNKLWRNQSASTCCVSVSMKRESFVKFFNNQFVFDLVVSHYKLLFFEY